MPPGRRSLKLGIVERIISSFEIYTESFSTSKIFASGCDLSLDFHLAAVSKSKALFNLAPFIFEEA